MYMYEASFRSLFQTLIVLGLLYYLFKFAIRLFAPILLNKVAKKAEESFRQKQESFYQNQQQNDPSENDFQSQFSKNKFPKEKKKVGEYIDFEEID